MKNEKVSAVSSPGLPRVFDLAGLLEEIREDSSWAKGKRVSEALLKRPGFSLQLVSMPGGDRIHGPKEEGSVILEVIEGEVRFNTADEGINLEGGDVLVLETDSAYDLVSLGECAFLLTLAGSRSLQA